METCIAAGESVTDVRLPRIVPTEARRIALRNGELWVCPRGVRQVHVRCIRGEVWITREGEPNDIVLGRDESRAMTVRGKLVVQALTDVTFEVNLV